MPIVKRSEKKTRRINKREIIHKTSLVLSDAIKPPSSTRTMIKRRQRYQTTMTAPSMAQAINGGSAIKTNMVATSSQGGMEVEPTSTPQEIQVETAKTIIIQLVLRQPKFTPTTLDDLNTPNPPVNPTRDDRKAHPTPFVFHRDTHLTTILNKIII